MPNEEQNPIAADTLREKKEMKGKRDCYVLKVDSSWKTAKWMDQGKIS